MDDPSDNNLENRIKEIFDNYEDTGADEGWLLLREKFPVQRSNRRGMAWLWWSAAAALVLLFLGVGLWLRNDDNTSLKLTRIPARQKPATRITSPAPAPDTVKGLSYKKRAKQIDTSATLMASTIKQTGERLTTHVLKKGSVTGNDHFSADTQGIQTFIAKNNTKPKKTVPVSVANVPDAAGNTVQSGAIAANKPVVTNGVTTSLVNNVPVKPIDKRQQNNINALFANDKAIQKDLETISTDKKIRFGVYAATYFNYARGSNNQVNVGAGVSSDIRLSKNLKLVTGVAIAQNTLNYTSSGAIPIAAAQQKIAVSSAVTAFTSLTLAAKPMLEAAPTFRDYNASLVGLDIPVNLKYEFSPQKNDTYVSAGLSSGTFINEAYTYNYNYPTNSSADQTQAQTDKRSFNSFYFAKTLNLAFGVGYPVGKNNRLVIEPFLKYPLDGLGAQQIRFGAGGVNLKLNFQSLKK